MKLTEQELSVLSDTEFLLTKARVIDKIQELLSTTRAELQKVVDANIFPFPKRIHLITGKISKGESYRQLPYSILDYPAYFNLNNIFAFRTMFWWGNFFSFTLHLQGSSLEPFRQKLIDHLSMLESEKLYISVGENPWQYHYEKDNYVLINSSHKAHIREADFIKLSKRIELSKWKELPELAKEYFSFLLKILG